MHDPRLTRRRLLAAIGGAAAAGALSACSAPIASLLPSPSPSPTQAPSTAPTTTPTPEPTATPSPTPTAPDPVALRRKASAMVMVGFRGFTIKPNDPITQALRGGLGGVILFSRETSGAQRNVQSPAQVARLTRDLRAAAPGPIWIAIDQEGGRVTRLGPDHGFPAVQSQAAVGATDDPAIARAAGRSIGTTLAAAGIDLDLAPVVDVDVDPRDPAIGALDRSFSADPAVVGAMAAEEIRGLHERGIKAAIKHFPGIGSATANTDFDRADVTTTWTRDELQPYATLIGLGLPDLVMSAHVLNGQIDPRLPASLSPATIDGLLRTELGWDGPVITDDLGAVAVTSTYTQSEAIALAIEAGNDLLLFANQGRGYVDDLAAQVTDTIVRHVTDGRITEARIDESVARLTALSVPTG